MDQLQELLYTNIALLNIQHPPSEDFKNVFKKDMFARSNKSAFFHVIHYLLTILNPQTSKDKLKTWPTCNLISRENAFRKEVLQYLNELNATYDADLPNVLSSHLIAPGGQKFVHFMYKLSQLVLLQQLKQTNPDEILHRPKPTKNERLNAKALENIVEITGRIDAETRELMDNFERKFALFRDEADRTVDEMNEICAKFKSVQLDIENEENANVVSSKELSEKFEELQQRSITIDNINEIHEECTNFMQNFKDVCVTGDFLECVKRKSVNLEKQLTELRRYTRDELEVSYEEIQEKEKILQRLLTRTKEQHENLLVEMDDSRAVLGKIVKNLSE